MGGIRWILSSAKNSGTATSHVWKTLASGWGRQSLSVIMTPDDDFKDFTLECQSVDEH